MTDLRGLESFRNLTELRIANNQIKNIDALSPLRLLAILDLSKNQNSMLSPLQSLENVYDLNLSNNQIEDISILEILTYLSYLDISSNNITPISLLIKLPSL
ncbi:leucine-rich repeat domain-containing protein [Turicibacter sanguinis]